MSVNVINILKRHQRVTIQDSDEHFIQIVLLKPLLESLYAVRNVAGFSFCLIFIDDVRGEVNVHERVFEFFDEIRSLFT
jgi:hypothetical protein